MQLKEIAKINRQRQQAQLRQPTYRNQFEHTPQKRINNKKNYDFISKEVLDKITDKNE